jgi:hypothetical protein
MVVLFRLTHAADNVRDPLNGQPITVYKLTVSIISKRSKDLRHIDRHHFYLAIKDESKVHQDEITRTGD